RDRAGQDHAVRRIELPLVLVPKRDLDPIGGADGEGEGLAWPATLPQTAAGLSGSLAPEARRAYAPTSRRHGSWGHERHGGGLLASGSGFCRGDGDPHGFGHWLLSRCFRS